MAAASLPEELVQEILVRLPPDEPVHLVRANLVCKAWRRVVVSDRGCFLRRCREFHGGAPPLFGYIRNRYHNGSPVGFVSATTSAASPVRMPAADCCSGWCALDCRHGRVLILDSKGELSKRLIVWDPITGSKNHLGVPPYYPFPYPTYCYAGAVLYAEDNSCDHLDCHGDPFFVVIVRGHRADTNILTWASVYSSKTGDWGIPTTNSFNINHRSRYHIFSAIRKRSLLLGDALYFPFENGRTIDIIKYDFDAHWLFAEIDVVPHGAYGSTLMKNEDGELELATLKNNCIYLWSRQDVANAIGRWVEHGVIELETLVPRCTPFEPYQLIGFAEGTNNVFINIFAGVFMLDIKSKNVRKIGKTEDHRPG